MILYYRLIIGLLLIFILVAYVDTKSLKQRIDDAKILRKYNHSSKLIGIGIKDSNGQVRIDDVIMNTPAEKSGLKVGDVLTGIDGQKAESAVMVKEYLNFVKKNKKIALTIQKPDNTVVEVLLTPTTITNFE